MLRQKLMALTISFAMVFAFATSDAPPDSSDPPCKPKPTRYLYVNGIDNTIPDSEMGAASLQGAMAAFGINGTVEPIWNPGDGFVADLAESATYNALGMSFVNMINRIYQISPAMPSLANMAQSTIRPYIDDLKARIVSGLKNQERFVLIAHSQGNYFVNTAVRELARDGFVGLENVSVVGIANPDSSGPGGNFEYITSSRDVVINYAVPGSLPPNFVPTLGSSSSDSLNHNLVDAYLDERVVDFKGNRLRDAVIGAIERGRHSAENGAVLCVNSGSFPSP